MIDLIFNYSNEVVIVRIIGHNVTFGSTMFGAKMANIEGLKLDFHGTIREFPDLRKDIEWRKKAIERFKDHIKKLDNEGIIADYIVEELKTKGYMPKLKQIAGFRAIKLS